MEIELKVALISALVSIGIWFLSFLFEPFKEKITLAKKLKFEHMYEQKKEIKKVLSIYKVQLLNSADSLNHRLSNMRSNYMWLDVNGDYENYYFKSTVYRLMHFYFWVSKAESSIFFLDTSIASNEDLIFIKFLKLFQKVFCDARLIVKVDNKYSTLFEHDHFFTDHFNSICLSPPDSYITFPSFESFDLPQSYLNNYLDGINPSENRYRWDIVQMLQYLLICFLNTYGYDYQHTSRSDIKNLVCNTKTKIILHQSFCSLLKDYGLQKQREIKYLIKMLIRSILI